MLEKKEKGIHYIVKGSGATTLVLLRGLARWSEHWLDFDSRLVAEGFRVVVIDNRGFGKSDAVVNGNELSLYDLADDVAEIVSKESPAGAYIVGLSLGGMIGLALAATKPQLVRGLMMVNSSVGASKLPRISKRALWSILQVFLVGRQGYRALASLLLHPGAKMEKREHLTNSWADIDSRSKISARELWRQLKAARSFSGLIEMSAAQCPVTIVRCDGDQFVDPRNSDFIHKCITHSKLVRHPAAGHELAVDDPEWFISTIKNVVS